MIAFCLLLAIAFSAAFASRCDPGWRYSPFTKKCYRFFDHETMWPSAEFSCLFRGSHLISIHNYHDNRFAIELARGAETVWLGNAQFGSSKDYVWSDHTPYDYESWPNNKRPDKVKTKPCTKLNTTTGEWFQSCCKKQATYICEKDVSPPNAHYANSDELLGLLRNKNSRGSDNKRNNRKDEDSSSKQLVRRFFL